MLAHKFILLFSTAIASSLYGVLYWLAPGIFLISVNSKLDDLEQRFQVKMDYVPKQQPFIADSRTEELSANAAKTLDDLLERETALMPEVETTPLKPVEIPELQDRLDTHALNREHDFEIDESVFAGIDAQILEIAEKDARKDIEIARRMVQPSSNHILNTTENPVFRKKGGVEAGGGTLGLDALVGTLNKLTSEQGDSDPGAAELSDSPGNGFNLLEAEADLFHPDLLEPEGSFAPEDLVMAMNPALEELNKESRFSSMDNLVNINLKTYIDSASQEGYFELKIVPSAEKSITVLPRDITFVIDASNSIVQRKLQLTARGVKSCIQTLSPEDHFNVIVFRSSPTLFRPERVPATPETIAEAETFLSELESFGSTDVYSAIKPVIQQAPRPGVPGIIFLMTDGRPSSGNLEGRQLINALSDENLLGNTIYTFGGGKTVNQYLLDLLAYRNKGESITFPRFDEIDHQLPTFFNRLSDAYLVGLQADFSRVPENSIFPRSMPDFYKGRVVTLYGRFTPGVNKDILIRLHGYSRGTEKEMVLHTDFSTAQKGDADIAKQWAFQKTYHLIGEVSRYGENPELMNEIQHLSKRYGVRSSYYGQ